jgi:molybdate-binding protein/DNA-binding XRE family transcriptional regulator
VTEHRLENSVRRRREELGLSQQALAERVGVSRQAVIAIEQGRQVPSTALALRLAHDLRVGVEGLFSLAGSEGVLARLAPAPEPAGSQVHGNRVALGEVEGRWAAHRLPPDAPVAADGIVAGGASRRTALVRPLVDAIHLRRNVLVAGCAPLLGTLAQRVGARFGDARATWLASNSRRSLDLLHARLVHVAGVHLSETGPGEDNAAVVRARFPGERMLIVNLTRWRQGLVVPAGNPLALRSSADLLRPGLRLARREAGAGAHKLLRMLLEQEGAADAPLFGPSASGHAEVAQLVRCGAADVGVAIESVALAAGLGFVPLAEERFDLVVPAALAETIQVARLLESLDDPGFRTEVAHLPGYDVALAGHVTTLEAA